MRLLIAGTLTLVIYLMACAYGSKGKTATEVKYTQTSLFWTPSHERYSLLPFVMFYFPPQQHGMSLFQSEDAQVPVFGID